MIAGFGVCAYYLWMTRYHAISFYETWSGLSGASEAAVTKFNELKAAYESAAPEAKAAALKALDSHAQTIANWFGVRNISSALFGLPAGFLGMIIGSLLTAAPSQAMQNFIDEIRRPKGKELMEGGNLVNEIH
jgi:cation/acetate symporter